MWYIANVPIVPENHGLIVPGFLFTTLAVTAVTLRVFTRLTLIGSVGWDDCFIVAAAFGTIGFLTAIIFQIKYGLGDTVRVDVIQKFLQSLLATIVCYSFTHVAVKLSIILQCKRIFQTTTAQRLFLALLIWMIVYGLFCFFSSLVTCVPIRKYWDPDVPGGCINRSVLHYVLAGINIANDMALLTAPLPFLKNLKIARRSKIILMGVFACGGFACIVAIIRLHALYVNNSAPIDQQPIKGVSIALWSGLEINVAIVCASVPALKPLFVKIVPQLISSITDSVRHHPRQARSASDDGGGGGGGGGGCCCSGGDRGGTTLTGSNDAIDVKMEEHALEMQPTNNDVVIDDESDKSLVDRGDGRRQEAHCSDERHGQNPHWI